MIIHSILLTFIVLQFLTPFKQNGELFKDHILNFVIVILLIVFINNEISIITVISVHSFVHNELDKL